MVLAVADLAQDADTLLKAAVGDLGLLSDLETRTQRVSYEISIFRTSMPLFALS